MALDGTLTPNQYRAIEHLLASGNVAATAQKIGVGRRTMYRWMAEPAFARALREAESTALEGLTRSLTMLGDKAVAALVAVFDDPEASHAVKIRAAAVVFSNHPTYLQTTALADRIAAIEAAQDGQP